MGGGGWRDGGTGWKGGTGQGGEGTGGGGGGEMHTHKKLILQKFAAHTEMFPLFD